MENPEVVANIQGLFIHHLGSQPVNFAAQPSKKVLILGVWRLILAWMEPEGADTGLKPFVLRLASKAGASSAYQPAERLFDLFVVWTCCSINEGTAGRLRAQMTPRGDESVSEGVHPFDNMAHLMDESTIDESNPMIEFIHVISSSPPHLYEDEKILPLVRASLHWFSTSNRAVSIPTSSLDMLGDAITTIMLRAAETERHSFLQSTLPYLWRLARNIPWNSSSSGEVRLMKTCMDYLSLGSSTSHNIPHTDMRRVLNACIDLYHCTQRK